MKLIFCSECHDIVKLSFLERTCQCGKSKGRYINDRNAEISGKAIPVGISNKSLVRALIDSRFGDFEAEEGIRFDVFFIPRNCKTIQRKEPE